MKENKIRKCWTTSKSFCVHIIHSLVRKFILLYIDTTKIQVEHNMKNIVNDWFLLYFFVFMSAFGLPGLKTFIV